MTVCDICPNTPPTSGVSDRWAPIGMISARCAVVLALMPVTRDTRLLTRRTALLFSTPGLQGRAQPGTEENRLLKRPLRFGSGAASIPTEVSITSDANSANVGTGSSPSACGGVAIASQLASCWT